MNRRDFLKTICVFIGAAALPQWTNVPDSNKWIEVPSYGRIIWAGLGDDGDDSNDGLSPDSPVTIASAIAMCEAGEAGEAIYLI